MSTWSFYKPDSGLFTGRVKTLPFDDLIEVNTPTGLKAIRGVFDRHTQRVDIATGEVVAYQRPQAEIDAEQRAERDQRIHKRIADHEAAQHRPMRELAVDPGNADAKRRLAEIEDQIAALRADLEKPSSAR